MTSQYHIEPNGADAPLLDDPFDVAFLENFGWAEYSKEQVEAGREDCSGRGRLDDDCMLRVRPA